MSWSPLGRPIRVGLFEHDPDAFNCFRRMPKKPCAKPGAEIEIISMVMQILDWQWEVVSFFNEFRLKVSPISRTNHLLSYFLISYF